MHLFLLFLEHISAWLCGIMTEYDQGGINMISRNNFVHLVVDRFLKERRKRILWYLNPRVGEALTREMSEEVYEMAFQASWKQYYLSLLMRLLTYYDFVKRNGGSEESLFSLINPIPFLPFRINHLNITDQRYVKILSTFCEQKSTISALAITPLMLKEDVDYSTEETIAFVRMIGMEEGDVR